MMNDNEFKNVITHPSKNNSFGKNIAVPFISGVLGCSLVLGTCFGVPSIKQKLFSGTGSSVSTSSGASASTSENSGTINTDLYLFQNIQIQQYMQLIKFYHQL